MVERVYITLREASEHLQAKGLTGQNPRVLRNAIAAGRLAALKDGRSWATTMAEVEKYESSLWHRRTKSSSTDQTRDMEPSVERSSRGSRGTSSGTSGGYAVSTLSLLNTLETFLGHTKTSSPSGGRRQKSQPRSLKRKREKRPTREEQEVAEFLARPAEEKKQRFKDYLDGKRKHWRY